MADKPGVLPAVSSTLLSLAHARELEYSRSCIKLVDNVENKYPLADIIMKSCTGMKVNGNLEGGGSAEFNDGHTYQGRFHNGVMHGEGKYTWKDGVVYEGHFTECKITGEGKYTWPDGSVYNGHVFEGLRHGQGTYHCSTTGGTYTGSWVAGLREGKGKLEYDTTGLSYYEGEWSGNQQEGYGVRKYRSGNVYEGTWSNNQRHGEGTMYWYDRGERYSGGWIGGIQNGQGEHVWIVNGTDNAQHPVSNRYVGEWKDGLREGNGTFYYASGGVYSGEWSRNKKQGRGKFVFQSGQVYKGNFNDDKMSGQLAVEGTDGALRPKTPLGSLIGDIDSSDQLAGGSVTEKFNLEISRVLPSDANKQHELKQVHCVILRYITQLKKIYHLYSSLGCRDDPKGAGLNTLTRLQLWRFLRDCHIHHLGFTIYDANTAVDPSSPCAHDPDTAFLMREFLQALVFLARYIYGGGAEQRGSSISGGLAQHLNQLISTHVLPRACSLGGLLYGQTRQHTLIALCYKQELWTVFQRIENKSPGKEKFVRVRDIFLLLQDCELITSELTASKVAYLLVNNDPLAYNEGYYNMEVKVTFLEFFEALLKCAVEWFKSPSHSENGHPVVEDKDSGNDPIVQWGQTVRAFFSHLLPKALTT